MAIVLLLSTKEGPPIEYPLLQKCVLGRSSQCDLTIEDKQMSGKHGYFELSPKGQVFYTDLDSTNGSFLNNSTIRKVQFRVNDSLRLGNTVIKIDPKRLSSAERISIGRSEEGKNDLTIVMSTNKGTRSRVEVPASQKKSDEEKEPTSHKKSVVLNKDLKKKLPKQAWSSNKNEQIIEQEESSGKTKMLKLNTSKSDKKK